METIKRITILENDIIHENNPISPVLDMYQEYNQHIDFTLWQWFSQDTMQNKEKSISRLKELSEDKEHAFLVYTSFIGYDNTFDGWYYFLSQLADLGIKLKIYIIFGGDDDENLLSYCLHHQMREKGYSDYGKKMILLEKAIDSHEVLYISHRTAFLHDDDNGDIFSLHIPLTLEEYKSYIHKKGDMVRIKETGEVKEVIYSYYSDSFSHSHVDVIMDEEIHNNNGSAGRDKYDHSAYKEFKLNEIEKV